MICKLFILISTLPPLVIKGYFFPRPCRGGAGVGSVSMTPISSISFLYITDPTPIRSPAWAGKGAVIRKLFILVSILPLLGLWTGSFPAPVGEGQGWGQYLGHPHNFLYLQSLTSNPQASPLTPLQGARGTLKARGT